MPESFQMNKSDPFRPSFFEVYATAHLSGALRPAFRYVLEILSVRHPTLVRFASRSDDIFTALLLVFETSQLRKESALLAESFYSLRRATSASLKQSVTSHQHLSARQIVFSVALAVVSPHVKSILDNWYSNATGGAAAELFAEGPAPEMVIRSNEDTDVAEESPLEGIDTRSHAFWRFPRLLVKVLADMKRFLRALRRIMTGRTSRRLSMKWYPRLSALFEGTDILFNLLYLFGHTKYFSLSLAIQGLVLRRASAAELLQSASHSTSFFSPGESHVDLGRIVSAASERLLVAFKASFFAGIFLFRFMQYYYAAEASAPRETASTIPAPEPLQPAAGVDQQSARAPGKCPICRKRRINPTACITSGYVFCHLCILQHIQENERCPVTLAPTLVDDLVRVYDEAGAT